MGLLDRARMVLRLVEQAEAQRGVVDGRLVGIEQRADGEQLLAVAVDDGRRLGVRLRARHAQRLRLGMPVMTRDGLLDWPAMCLEWGLAAQSERAEPLAEAGPEDGVLDATLSVPEAWPRARARLESLDRRLQIGAPSDDHLLALTIDGEARTITQHVPSYAAWLARPGAELPVAVSPEDPASVVVDWPAAAVEHAGRAGGFADDPPEGSLAETIERGRLGESGVDMEAFEPPSMEAPAEGLEPIAGVSLSTWATVTTGFARDAVMPGDYDTYAESHGVAPGAWPEADAGWKARMTSDWRIGAQVAQALQHAQRNP